MECLYFTHPWDKYSDDVEGGRDFVLGDNIRIKVSLCMHVYRCLGSTEVFHTESEEPGISHPKLKFTPSPPSSFADFCHNIVHITFSLPQDHHVLLLASRIKKNQ